MSKSKIPVEWDLGADRRYKRQNMERAMRRDIERGLVELITNSDDSYRDLEDDKKQTSGKIRIEIKRRNKKTSTVKVLDRACGMNRHEMYESLGSLGGRTSGFEKGKARRGLNGRGAKDVAAFGTVHFESIKDGEYNHLIIPPSLKCRFGKPKRPPKASKEIRQKLGIPRGNGTVVTIDVESRFQIPQHEKLVQNFSRYYSLRDIFSNPGREVTLVDLNKKREDPLTYNFPLGEVVFDHEIQIPNYPNAAAHLIIRQHKSPFEQEMLPYREGGILVKSEAAIHDCTYFGVSEPFAWRFTGELRCKFIDKLILEYDNREEANPNNPNHPADNPMRLLDPFRDGLMLEHPFAQALYKKCKEILQPFVDKLKEAEEPSKRDVTNENLDKKLSKLSKKISNIFEKKIKELEEEIPPGSIKTTIEKLDVGLHIIPPEEQPIIINQPKTFSIIVKHYEALDYSLPVNIVSSNPEDVKVRTSPVFLGGSSGDDKVGRTTFTVESSNVGTEAFIEVRYDGYDNSLLVKVIEPPPAPEVPDGFSFEKPLYHLRINKEKTLTLRLKTSGKIRHQVIAQITSDRPTQIAVKGGGKCELHKADRSGLFIGKCRITGRQLKAKGEITARVKGFEPAKTHVTVEEQEPKIDFKRPKPVEDNFSPLRYKWDNNDAYLLLIGAKHPSIRKYLGEPTGDIYPGVDSSRYHIVLSEVIAEALAFRVLEVKFKREGQEGMLDYQSTDLYYHKHFSDFLTIAHEILVTESIGK